MKRTVNLYLDSEIIKHLQNERINISELVNNYLKSYITPQVKQETDEEVQFKLNKERSDQAYQEWLSKRKKKTKADIKEEYDKLNQERIEALNQKNQKRADELKELMKPLYDVLYNETED